MQSCWKNKEHCDTNVATARLAVSVLAKGGSMRHQAGSDLLCCFEMQLLGYFSSIFEEA